MLPAGKPLLAAAVRALPVGLLLVLAFGRLPNGSWWWRAFVLGALNIGLFFALLFVAAYRLPGGVAATVGAVQPLVVAALACPLLGERLTWRKALAGAIRGGGRGAAGPAVPDGVGCGRRRRGARRGGLHGHRRGIDQALDAKTGSAGAASPVHGLAARRGGCHAGGAGLRLRGRSSAFELRERSRVSLPCRCGDRAGVRCVVPGHRAAFGLRRFFP